MDDIFADGRSGGATTLAPSNDLAKVGHRKSPFRGRTNPIECPTGIHGLYIIKGLRDDLIKIGITRTLSGRLNQLQQATPYKLRVLFFQEYGIRAREIETETHRLLAPWRERGEWFRVAPLVLAGIAIEAARDDCAHRREFLRLQPQPEYDRHLTMNFPELWDRVASYRLGDPIVVVF